jgi:hypothetical protein
MLLAGSGLRVLVVDRAAEGSDTISGHMIKPDGVARLAAWGILPDLLGTGCPPISAAEVVIDGRRLARTVFQPGIQPPIAPRRTILDRLLQEHARRADARVRCSTAFRSWRNGVVTLSDSTVRTRLLIGADGRRSTVARVFAAPYADVRPGRSCAWYAYWDHSPLTEARAELRHGIFAGAFPTHSAQVLAFAQLPVTAWRPGQGEQDLRAGLARCPSVAAGLDNAEPSGRVVGVRDLPTYFRRAAGTGWALVGDAAHHKDPLAARGIFASSRLRELGRAHHGSFIAWALTFSMIRTGGMVLPRPQVGGRCHIGWVRARSSPQRSTCGCFHIWHVVLGYYQSTKARIHHNKRSRPPDKGQPEPGTGSAEAASTDCRNWRTDAALRSRTNRR